MYNRRPSRTVPVALLIAGIVLLVAAGVASTDDGYSQYASAAPQYVMGRGYDAGVAITPAAPTGTETCRTVMKRRVNEFGEVVAIRTRVCAEPID